MTRFGLAGIQATVEEGVEALGVRPYARSIGVPVGVVRSALAKRDMGYDTIKLLCDSLGLDLYIGPRRTLGPVLTPKISGTDFAAVPRYNTAFSAGPGALNEADLPAGAIAFRQDWLNREEIDPGACMVVSVKGDSMAPTLHDGDLVLVDRRNQTPRGRRIYALIGPDGEARIKRVERLPTALLLQSDNEQFPTELIPAAEADRIQILGEVVWWGHTVKE